MNLSILAIFGAGVLTFSSPCVLPLIPAYLAAIAGGSTAPAPAARMVARAAAFAAGLTFVFVSLGALASSLGALLTEHRATLLWISGSLMIVFGLRSLGLVRIRALDIDARPLFHRLDAASGLFGAFVFGAAFALGWSPCIGPVLASVLTFAATSAQTPWEGAAYLLVYALGISIPLILLAAVTSRAARWLKAVRVVVPKLEAVTGAALVALGIWTVLPLASPAKEEKTAVASEPAARHAEPTTCSPDSPTGHLCGLPNIGASPGQPQPTVEGAHMLEFTSDDCPVCRRMRPVVEKLKAACGELDQRIVRVDVATSSGRALADKYGVRGTPTFILFDQAGAETTRLFGETSREDVAVAIERATGLSCWG